MAYTHPGIRARRKGERRDGALLGGPQTFCFERPGLVATLIDFNTAGAMVETPIGRVKVVGEFQIGSPYSKTTTYPADLLEIYLTDGTVVPAWRKRGGPDNNYAICQDYEFKAARPVT